MNLIPPSGKFSQTEGKATSGWTSVSFVLAKGISISSAFLSSTWGWPSLRILFVNHVFSNKSGRKPCTKLCINCILKNSVSKGKGRISSDLKIGSVWALYLLWEIIRIAAFCLIKTGLRILSKVDVQIWFAYTKCEWNVA